MKGKPSGGQGGSGEGMVLSLSLDIQQKSNKQLREVCTSQKIPLSKLVTLLK